MVYYGLIFISIAITLLAQALVTSRYKKYAKVENKKGLTGVEVAQTILKKHNLENVYAN